MSERRSRLLAVVVCATVGCSSILGLDDDYGPRPDAGVTSTAASTGGAGGGGGETGGAGGATGSAGAAGAGGCPTPAGPRQILIDGWSIDATEITNEQFAAFVCGGQPRAASNTWCDSVPARQGTIAGPSDEPVSDVSWCDAFDYCEWAGRRLCGKIGGGGLAHAEGSDPTLSQWFHACTSNDPNNHTFPYGNGYGQDICVGAEYAMGAQQKVDAGTVASCKATAFDVYDLSGNVREWEDACEADDCLVRGGSHLTSDHNHLKCTYGNPPFAPPLSANRQAAAADIGFRCCADP